ncbi:MAG: ATP-dependent DNA helicase RecG [Phycisphaerales bacterium]
MEATPSQSSQQLRTRDGSPLSLTTAVTELPGVSEHAAGKLISLGAHNLGLLLAHLPHRHEWIRARAGLEELEAGVIGSTIGEISALKVSGYGRKARLQVVLIDEHGGRLDLVFFNQAFLAKKLEPGMFLNVQGTPKIYGPGLQISNPKFTIIPFEDLDKHTSSDQDDEYRPVYPATSGLTSDDINDIIKPLLPAITSLIKDHLSDDYRKERALPTLADAYRMMHAPEDEDQVGIAKRRLAYDELLLLQLGVHMKRAHLRSTMQSPALPSSPEIDERIAARIPFTLTPDQQRVSDEIAKDLSHTTPTNRLIQGDVGSGKTVVALSAMLRAIAHGHQAVLMAPTELLAEQHYLSITRMLEGSNTRIALLTGSLPADQRASILSQIQAGELDLIIGTHSLVSDKVAFNSLAVAIIDEQHRFGVQQRAKLRVKGSDDSNLTTSIETPHVIVMTATPIPRTIGLTIFGDLDISTIEHLPKGRIPITTKLVNSGQRSTVYNWLNQKIKQGQQAYIVVPAIESSGASAPLQTETTHTSSELVTKSGSRSGTRNLRDLKKELEGGELHDVNIAAMHGKLKRDTRERIMHRFREGEIECLIATTVIEVGVDVPNACVIVIEDADRFGLAQLHQLRGRVGRGDQPSVCVLIAEPKTEDGTKRLEAMIESTSGFVLAQRDLEIRGPGDVFGTRQSGMPPFKVADPLADHELLGLARRDAGAWIERSPKLEAQGESLVRRRLLKAHGQWLGVGDVG